jgi:glycosyltransferase involved in cell wall biosynthesis
MPKIVCIIPAFNERANIAQVIKDVKPFVDNIIVVDDGSDDQTAEIAFSAGALVVSHAINRGQGAALETGDEFALSLGADAVIHFDADGQFVAQEIPSLLAPLLSGNYDVVLGSRFLNSRSRIPFSKKKLILPLARLINRIFFDLHFTDPQSGFRALSRPALEVIKIEQDGMSHCNEILIKIKQNKLRVIERPITVIYHEYGQSFGGGYKILKDLLLARLLK